MLPSLPGTTSRVFRGISGISQIFLLDDFDKLMRLMYEHPFKTPSLDMS